jgi:hypothetical protein
MDAISNIWTVLHAMPAALCSLRPLGHWRLPIVGNADLQIPICTGQASHSVMPSARLDAGGPMDAIGNFARYARSREEEMSIDEYLAECKRDPMAYATAA